MTCVPPVATPCSSSDIMRPHWSVTNISVIWEAPGVNPHRACKNEQESLKIRRNSPVRTQDQQPGFALSNMDKQI